MNKCITTNRKATGTYTIALVCLLYLSFSLHGAMYWVQFSDKKQSRDFLSKPETFLSQKSIERRKQQNIRYSEHDLPVSDRYIADIAQSGVRILNNIKWLNGIIVMVDESETGIEAIHDIAAKSFVTGIKKVDNLSNGNTRIDKFEKPQPYRSTDFIPEQSRYDYGKGAKQIQQLNGHKVHDLGFDGKGVVIAIIDGGYQNTNTIVYFKPLWDEKRIVGSHDFVSPNNPNLWGNSSNHGTMVLSTIAAMADGDFVGTAPKASFLLYRTEDGAKEGLFEEYLWVDAAEAADSAGARIITSSLGYSEFDDASENHTYKDMDGNTTPCAIGADIAAKNGLIVIISAGNSGGDPWKYLTTPSDGDSAFCIAACDENGNKAYFSSFGPSSDGDTKPNVAAMGVQSTVIEENGTVSSASGTSFSCPITAGMVACLVQAFPKVPGMTILEVIQKSGSQANNPDDKLGYGIPDYKKAYDLLNQTHSVSQPKIMGNENGISLSFTKNNEVLLHVNTGHKALPTIGLSIYNLAGMRVYAKNFKNNNGSYTVRDLNHLSRGVYVFVIQLNDNLFHKKLFSFGK